VSPHWSCHWCVFLVSVIHCSVNVYDYWSSNSSMLCFRSRRWADFSISRLQRHRVAEPRMWDKGRHIVSVLNVTTTAVYRFILFRELICYIASHSQMPRLQCEKESSTVLWNILANLDRLVTFKFDNNAKITVRELSDFYHKWI